MEIRGQVYSMIVILLAIPLLLFIAFYITSSQSVDYSVVERVVADQEHEIEKSIGDDFERALEISAKRAMLAASNDVITTGVALENATSSLRELMVNGTLRGNETYVMINNSLEDWRGRIVEIDVGFGIVLEFNGLSIESYRDLNLRLLLDMYANISDSLNISRIDKRLEKVVLVPVEGFEDPLFPLNTGGYAKRMIRIYPYPYYARKVSTGSGEGGCSGNASFDPSSPDPNKIVVVNDATGVSGFRGVVSETGTSSLSCHLIAANAVDDINSSILESGYNNLYIDNATQSVWSLPLVGGLEGGYYYPEAGPDILQRLEADLSENENGFETFVDTEYLEGLGIEIKEGQSLVDYLYFSGQSHPGSPARGFPDWFRIDSQHAMTYGISELL